MQSFFVLNMLKNKWHFLKFMCCDNKKTLNVSTNFILYKIYLATVFYPQSDDRNCKSELLLHKETTDFAANVRIKNKFSELNTYLPWFFSCQIKKHLSQKWLYKTWKCTFHIQENNNKTHTHINSLTCVTWSVFSRSFMRTKPNSSSEAKFKQTGRKQQRLT